VTYLVLKYPAVFLNYMHPATTMSATNVLLPCTTKLLGYNNVSKISFGTGGAWPANSVKIELDFFLLYYSDSYLHLVKAFAIRLIPICSSITLHTFRLYGALQRFHSWPWEDGVLE
jgi:hypothetical protein